MENPDTVKNEPGDSPKEIHPVTDRLKCLFRKEFYSIIPFYLLVLIPGASAIAWACRKFLDPMIKTYIPYWEFPVGRPWNLLLAAVVIFFSGIALLYTYSFLILEGGGGPCPPFTGKTERLVTVGPYKYVRHPSILVKLAGVTALGAAFQSLSFIFIAIPVLLTGSLILNRRLQEEPLVEKFGSEYEEYRRKTPFILPNISDLLKR